MRDKGLQVHDFGKHAEEGFEAEGACTEEIHPRFNYGPFDKGNVVDCFSISLWKRYNWKYQGKLTGNISEWTSFSHSLCEDDCPDDRCNDSPMNVS